MRTTLNLRPEALLLVKSVARQRKLSLGDAASQLICDGAAGKTLQVKVRNRVPLARNDGVVMTVEEVVATLADE